MAIPGYETLMLPVLRYASGRPEAEIRACVAHVAEEFGLTLAEREAMLPSGRQTVVANRTHWAKTYLTQAGLLARTRRGAFAITERGGAVLQQAPEALDSKSLREFEEFRAFQTRRRDADDTSAPANGVASASRPSVEAVSTRATPRELIEAAHKEISEALQATLLDRLLASSPAFFERVVVDLLVAMGYGGSRPDAGRRIGRSGDGGIDGIINEDQLGLDIVYVQAKRYARANAVGVEKVREFAGALVERGAAKGVFVTTSTFASGAYGYAERIPQRLVLIDGAELTRLMIRFGVGVRVEQAFELKRLDLDYFEEEDAALS